MSDQVKFKRMLEILIFLSGNYGYTIDEIAERFHTTSRTIYRYIETFRAIGFKVIKRNGFYCIEKKDTKLRELSDLVHFTEEEAILLSRAIHLVSDESKFKSDLYEKLYYLFDAERIANQLITQEHADNALKLKKAIASNKIVLLKNYASLSGKPKKDRVVEPFEFTSIYDFVWAYDIADKQCKTFKIARIEAVVIKPEPQQNKAHHTKAERDVFRFSGPERIEVSFSMTPRVYNLLIEEFPVSEQFIVKKDTDTFIFKGWVRDFRGISRFILGMMHEISIHEPNTLREYLNEQISKKIF